MKILLLSGYDADSHKRWREGLVSSAPEHNWTVLSLPARRFSWRYTGNAYSWFAKQRDCLTESYDLLICTSMVNLGMLRGLIPSLAQIRTIVYCHENQFVYPIQHKVVQREMFHLCLQSIYTTLCADTIVFNSEYNRGSFIHGARELLKKMPDFAPRTPLQNIEENSVVLPVPIEDSLFNDDAKSLEPIDTPHILWNHRWEYDKAPDRLFLALEKLQDSAIPFRLSVVGQQFSNIPDCFHAARNTFASEIEHWGFLESKFEYQQLLKNADVVVSTAVHEFQGLALLEAIAGGCIPIAPTRLAYPEYVQESHLYTTSDNLDVEAQALADKIIAICQAPSTINIDHYRSSLVWPKYHALLGL